jgi:hypothetical protein
MEIPWKKTPLDPILDSVNLLGSKSKRPVVSDIKISKAEHDN